MRTARLSAILLLLPLVVFGRETAYQALRVVGKQRSQTQLNQVIEIKARNGTPQPAAWTLLLNDPMARGGVRELEVVSGHIVSERTPVKTGANGKTFSLAKLNLDSEGAFAVAEHEARVVKLGFYGANYTLCADPASDTPVWVLHLLDKDQNPIASVTIAADTGQVISKTFSGHETKGSWSAGGGLKGRLQRFGDAVGNSFRNAGDRIQDFWDGGSR